jgi:hypothetical protein
MVVSASSNFTGLDVFALKESNAHLVLLVINKDPDAQITEPFTIQGFSPSGKAQVWQYSEVQDYAQSKSTTGAAALASSAVTLTLSGSNFSYSFPAYSMTAIDLSPATPSAPDAVRGLTPTPTPTLTSPPTPSATRTPSPMSPSNIPHQVQQFGHETVLMEPSGMSGNVTALLLTLQEDYESLVMTMEQEILQEEILQLVLNNLLLL